MLWRKVGGKANGWHDQAAGAAVKPEERSQ